MLDHIEADDRIEAVGEVHEMIGVAQIAFPDLHIRPASEAHTAASEMFVIDIGSDISFASAGELPGHVPNTRAKFENVRTDPWTNRIGHPPIEAPGAGH